MEFIALRDKATQLWALEIFFGFCCPKAVLNDQLFMQVMAALVSNSHEIFWFPAHTFILGLTLSPGAKILNSLVQVANETTHRLRSNCGMTIELCINGTTNPVSEVIREIPLCYGSSFVAYLLSQYLLPCLSAQG
jgi:hypothetical protein